MSPAPVLLSPSLHRSAWLSYPRAPRPAASPPADSLSSLELAPSLLPPQREDRGPQRPQSGSLTSGYSPFFLRSASLLCLSALRLADWGASPAEHMLRKLPWAARWEMVFPQGASSHFGSRQSQSSPRLRAVQALGSAQPSAQSLGAGGETHKSWGPWRPSTPFSGLRDRWRSWWP